MIRPLTPTQERFCQEIIKGNSQSEAYRVAFQQIKHKKIALAITLAILSGFTPSEAYRKAFNAKGMSKKVISVKAAELLRHEKITVAITVAVNQGQVPAIAPPVPASIRLSMEERLEELRCAARLDPADAFDDLNHFKSIREMPEHVRRAIASYEVDPEKLRNRAMATRFEALNVWAHSRHWEHGLKASPR